MRALLILISLPLAAQFSNLTTTNDGSRLYFSSTLQLTGSTDPTSNRKIFVYDGTSIRLFASIAKVSYALPPPASTQSAIVSNYYDLRSPLLSGNGTETGYVGYADCVGPCTYNRVLGAQTTFQFAGAIGSLTLPYACNVSASGRYALCQTGLVPGYPLPAVLIDLATMQQSVPIATGCAGSPHCVASNGTVLLSTMGPLALWTPSETQTLPLNSFGVAPMVSDDASLVVHGTSTALAIYNVATGVDIPLLPYLIQNSVTYVPSLFGISNDARWVLAGVYKSSNGTLLLIDSSNGSSKQLLTATDGVQRATISGDGSTVYAVTSSGRLVKIDAHSGMTQEFSGSQPVVTSLGGAAVPGSLTQIFGGGLTSSGVTLNGAPVPIVSQSLNEIDLQIPWKTPTGTATLAVTPASATPFQQVTSLQILALGPVLMAQAIHQDFSGFISPQSPAVGGEVVNYYFTGLGPVSPAVKDGVQAGSNPLSLVTTPLTLLSDTGQSAAKIVYAGLAPGTVGVYQVSIQLPASINRTNRFLPGGPNLFTLTLNGIDISVWALPNQ